MKLPAFVVCFGLLLHGFGSVQVQTQPPPAELFSIGAHSQRLVRLLHVPSSDQYVYVRLRFGTKGKTVLMDWTARNDSQSLATKEFRKFETSFWPTAICVSIVDPTQVYVAGWDGSAPVLENWQIGAYNLNGYADLATGQQLTGLVPRETARL